MSEESNTPVALNIYEEALNEDTTWDLSSQGLEEVPELTNRYLSALYLQNNAITTLPSDIFTTLKHLKYLDLRDNQLTDIPASIKLHHNLSHLLLQNNKLTTLPNELGTVPNLKVLQLGGNPLMYPPREIINAGVSSVKKFLNEQFINEMFANDASSDITGDSVSSNGFYPEHFSQDGRSYNSVLDEAKLKKAMRIRVNERDSDDSDEEKYAKLKGKCPKLAKSRSTIPTHYQSSKYVQPSRSDGKMVFEEKIKESYMKDLALKKHKDLLESMEKILQGRKNLEQLKNWRSDYRMGKFPKNGSYKIDSNNYPYDTNPDYMSILNRDDIEKDLPDKYRKKLVRRSKPTVPRKSNNDVHLALKIKQLFDNLESIELNRKDMTPRTEQKMLLNEIQKISEIRQKLMELSTTNSKTVEVD
ncbi:uncharacterized protein LOC118270401 [Spodoptera frugiperda]|uniref:Uncharacterized protein LOC118270401 n=1 Tax=Spodoptera frugiperda TaxID=7108 RepID=A0A9R0EL52_SPOFR|nr:uncharacterized protein LOC118270401 [Spodoptera frugiperda]